MTVGAESLIKVLEQLWVCAAAALAHMLRRLQLNVLTTVRARVGLSWGLKNYRLANRCLFHIFFRKDHLGVGLCLLVSVLALTKVLLRSDQSNTRLLLLGSVNHFRLS